MTKKTKKAPSTNSVREVAAEKEYTRLIELYTAAGVDEIKLKIDDSLIRKIAEIYGTLEAIKDLPTIRFNPNNPEISEETAAGKARVKYMAQYAASMVKLNKDLLGVLGDPDDDSLKEFEED